ncbi:MAG: DNA polymerase III subunit beta, partial [Cyanobacteria bacterium REEB65]|nr:DNA polymerase III subunit beta [Cyanobacteria bacterium REEB65]
NGAQATVLCERSRFVLPSLPADEFPKLPAAEDRGGTVTLPAVELARGIRQTAFAASKDDKSVISGLLLRLSDSTLEVVATDGYRLAWWRWEGAGSGNLEVIVPARAMNELARLLGSSGSSIDGAPEAAKVGSASVTVGKAGNQILFSFGDRFLTSRTIDGAFPNFRQIVPASFQYEVQIDRSTLLASVERAGIMASEREGKAVRMAFSDGDLRLWARASELGEVDEHLPVDFAGEAIEIAFNARYLEDALKAIEGETVTFKLNGPMQAALITGADPVYASLLMPIRS